MQSRQFYCMHHAGCSRTRHPAISLVPHLACDITLLCSSREFLGLFHIQQLLVSSSKWPPPSGVPTTICTVVIKKKRTRKWSGIWLKAAQEGTSTLKVKNTNFLRENIWGVENSQIFTVTPWKTTHCLRSLEETMRGPFGWIDYCMVRLYFLFLKFSQESGTYRGGILKSPLLRSWCQEIMGIKAAACVYM